MRLWSENTNFFRTKIFGQRVVVRDTVLKSDQNDENDENNDDLSSFAMVPPSRVDNQLPSFVTLGADAKKLHAGNWKQPCGLPIMVGEDQIVAMTIPRGKQTTVAESTKM